jgi:hypothetical protein
MLVALVEQTVDAGDTDVVQALDGVAGELGRPGGLLGDTPVRRAGGDHQNGAFAGHRYRCDRAHGDARLGMVLERRTAPGEGLGGGGVEARDQHVLTAGGETRGDGGDLVGALADAEDDLRLSGAELAVQIRLGERQVCEGQVAERLERGIDRELAALHAGEQLLQSAPVHRRDATPPRAGAQSPRVRRARRRDSPR